MISVGSMSRSSSCDATTGDAGGAADKPCNNLSSSSEVSVSVLLLLSFGGADGKNESNGVRSGLSCLPVGIDSSAKSRRTAVCTIALGARQPSANGALADALPRSPKAENISNEGLEPDTSRPKNSYSPIKIRSPSASGIAAPGRTKTSLMWMPLVSETTLRLNSSLR